MESDSAPQAVVLRLSTSLPDFMWHLLNLSPNKTYSVQAGEIVESFCKACRILKIFAQTSINAQRALAAVKGTGNRNTNQRHSTLEQTLDSTLCNPQHQSRSDARDSDRLAWGNQPTDRDSIPDRRSSRDPYLEQRPGFPTSILSGSSDPPTVPVGSDCDGPTTTARDHQTGSSSPQIRKYAVDDLSETYGDLDLMWRTVA